MHLYSNINVIYKWKFITPFCFLDSLAYYTNLNGVTDVKGFYNIAGRPLRRWTSYMSSPTTTTKLQNWWRPPQLQPQNFGTGANGRYYKDSARIPEVCLREELWLPSKLQQYMNSELPDVQAGLGKGRGTRDQIANICWIIKKSTRVPEKHLFLLYWLCQSLWLCGSQ